MIDLQPEHVLGLWDVLQERFNLRLVAKDNAFEMSLVGQALESLGVMDQRDFLRRYATTIGRTIYLPFELGDAGSRGLVSQARTIAHEAQHAHDYTTLGGPSWAFKYLTDHAHRAVSEARAMTTSAEVGWLIEGVLPESAQAAEKLRAYALGDADIATVAAHLRIAYKTIAAGGVTTEAGKVAREYFS